MPAQPTYRTALITGASSGIGRALALWFARRGTKVYAAARRTKQLEALAREGEGRIEPMALDVSREAETVRRIQELDDACGGLELVIANAGIGDATPARLVSWEEIERVLRVNVSGAAATITAVLPRMVERDRGHVVGVSSIAARAPLGAYSAYCASKSFLSMFLAAVRVDLSGTNVKATTIEPGFVKSEMSARLEGKAPTPFMAETDVAADRFGRAILRGARVYAYPKIHSAAAQVMGLSPAPIYEPLARRASRPLVDAYVADAAPANEPADAAAVTDASSLSD